MRLGSPSLVLLALVAAAAPGAARELRKERVHFAPGTSSATVEGRITGDDIVDYLLNARAGQTANISMTASRGIAYFNLIAPSQTDVAIFNGSMGDNQFEGVLPETGDYKVRVYLMGNRAATTYRLEMIVNPYSRGSAGAGAPSANQSGRPGGPDVWEVTGLTRGDTLNVREGPGTTRRIVARLANGAIVRHRGCEMRDGQQWCAIEPEATPSVRGWVAGRYLRERTASSGSTPSNTSSAGGESAAERAGQGRFDAEGTVPCAQHKGQPMGQCPFGVARDPGGSAAMVVTRFDGRTRALFFEKGRFLSADTSQADGYPPVSATRESDLNMIRVGDERYEVPDAVPFGG